MDTHYCRQTLKVGREVTVDLSKDPIVRAQNLRSASVRNINTLLMIVEGILSKHEYDYSGTSSLREVHRFKMVLVDFKDWLKLPLTQDTAPYGRPFLDALVAVVGQFPAVSGTAPTGLIADALATQLITGLGTDSYWVHVLKPCIYYVANVGEHYKCEPVRRGSPARVFALTNPASSTVDGVGLQEYLTVYNWERALQELAVYKSLGIEKALLKVVVRIPNDASPIQSYVVRSTNVEEFNYISPEDMPHE